jgi:branched-chain amino acid transport system ATP-binding protein
MKKPMVLLQVQKLNKNFGGLAALHRVDLNVLESEILGIIGPNGAGKTTLFNVITGLIPPTEGKVIFKEEDITGLRADQIARRGIGRTFQASVLFMENTVFENVFIAFHMDYRQPGWKSFLHTPGAIKEELVIRQRAMEIMEFAGLASIKEELAMNLPHGHQRVLGVSLALATRPSLLLLDEPATGMNPVETSAMVDLIRKIRERGTGVVIVEHDMKAVMSLCDRIIVLNHGVKIAEGPPEEIRKNKEVIEAYLGKER